MDIRMRLSSAGGLATRRLASARTPAAATAGSSAAAAATRTAGTVISAAGAAGSTRPRRTMRLEFLDTHAAITVLVDLLEDLLGLRGVLLGHRARLEFVEADGA